MKLSIIKDLLNKFRKIIFLLIWLGLWQGVYYMVRRDIFVPSPFMVFEAFIDLVPTEAFWASIAWSIFRVLIGLLFSVFFGVVLGVISGLKPVVFEFLSPLMSAIKATPVMSFIILALVWFQSGMVPIFICFLMCFPVIWTNVVAGIKNVDIKLIEMAKIYEVKETTIIRSIYLPSILPYFTAGVTMSLGLGWKVSVAAEVLSHPRFAIGSNLHSAKAYLDTPSLFAWTFVVIILSILFEKIFRWGLKKGAKREHQG